METVKRLKKYSVVIVLFLLVAIIVSSWRFPALARILTAVLFLIILGISLSSIFENHKQVENPRSKITKDILILILTLLLIVFLGGLAGMLANHYFSLNFGTVAGFVSAISASFVVGYFVKWGMGKLSR